MEHQLAFSRLRNHFLFKLVQRQLPAPITSAQSLSVETDRLVSADAIVEAESAESDLDEDSDAAYDAESVPPRKRSKKRKIYCFTCNRQEFHIMAYKGTTFHSVLVGVTFGLARIFGPYRCTCCGKKRAMFADFCSLSYHWRVASERRLSKSTRRRRSSSSRRRR